MKKLHRLIVIFLLSCFMLSLSSFARVEVPQPTNAFFVNDFARILSSDTEEYLQNVAIQLQEQTTAQVVIVTIDSLDGGTIEDYAYQLFKEWGIGTAKDNNGVLMLVAVGDRQSRIEVGYGLEGALPDGKTGRIQDNYMIPYFKEGDYDSGVQNGFLAIVREIYAEYGIEPGNLDTPDRKGITIEGSDGDFANAVFIIIMFIVLLVDWIFLRGRLTRFFFKAAIFSRHGGSSYRGGGGSRGGGGFSGGGGRSGGGGSSRGW